MRHLVGLTYHMEMTPRFCIGLIERWGAKYVTGQDISDADAIKRLLAMPEGDVVANGACDNQDEHGHCLGHKNK